MNPRDRMVGELRELVHAWIARGENPADGVWVFAYSAIVGLKTSPPELYSEARQALENGLAEGYEA